MYKTYKQIAKIINLACYGLIGFALASFFHYVATIYNLDLLKIVCYLLILIIALFLIIFEETFAEYLELEEKGISAILIVFSLFFFIGGSIRAILLNQPLEAILLFLVPSLTALILFVIYLKLLFISIFPKKK
jgi:hypothetical protein